MKESNNQIENYSFEDFKQSYRDAILIDFY